MEQKKNDNFYSWIFTSDSSLRNDPYSLKTECGKIEENPTAAQIHAGNYAKGHIWIDGLNFTIENPKGSYRSGVDRYGKKWKTLMNNTYGYICGTEGVDGDHIDMFISERPLSGNVYIVDQVNPQNGRFDEHKVMFGFPSRREAKEAYLSNYERGWKGCGEITEISKEDFKQWIKSSRRKTKPFSEYVQWKED